MSSVNNKSCQPTRPPPPQPPQVLNTTNAATAAGCAPTGSPEALRQPDITAQKDIQRQMGCAPQTSTPQPPQTAQPLNYGELMGQSTPNLGCGECGPALPPAEAEALQKSQQAILDAGVALFAMASGQSLEDVAKQFDSSIAELKQLNPGLAERLDSTVGKAMRDQMIAVPVGASDTRGAPPSGEIVERGPNAYKLSAPNADAIRNGNGAVTMHRGMGGPEVQNLQRRLNAMGANPPLAVDGKFGPKTEAALKAFQSANGIQQTGVLGRQTLGSLDAPNARRIPADALQPPASNGTGSTNRVGASTLSGSAFGNQIGDAAEREANRLNSVGRCALGVNNALVSLGVPGRGHAYQKAEQLANNPRFREVNISASDLSNLPRGAVVVWGRSSAKPYGHVSVALGGGREASDHIQRQITGGRYGTDFGNGPDPQGRQFRVFLPA